MYEAYYGLSSKPFQLNPDPAFYFGSKQHKRAQAYLEYGLHQNEGFIVVTGEIGAGKTTIVRGLLEGLDASKVVAAHLVSTQMDAEDTLKLVGAAFGVRTKDVEKAEVLMGLEAFLVDQAAKGKRCLLIVDEAQNLTQRAVEELRMLSNFQFGNHSLLQSFLVGQPEFRDILQSPHMQQLRQRVIASCHIGPLDRDETQAYVEHRLKRAGANDKPTFEAAAFDVLYRATGGIPRRINNVCDRLLLFGFLASNSHFTAEEVTEVAKEIYEETGVAPVHQVFVQAVASGGQVAHANLPDLGDLQGELESSVVEQFDLKLTDIRTDALSARLQRLERSLIRLEHSNTSMLALLQQLVEALKKKPGTGSESQSE